MAPVPKKYKVIRRINLDFEIVVPARNEFEATFNADGIELDSWQETNSSWVLVNVERISHLELAPKPQENAQGNRVIQIWRRT
jgi:hypothetical protein